MKYENIKTPVDLSNWMLDNITYGFVGINGKVYSSKNIDEFEKKVITDWRLSSPERLREVRYGHCWDQVELEREWFSNNGYEVKTFYIWFQLPYENSFSTHTYLVYKDNDKYFYFENSDFANRGIHEFNSLEDAIEYQKEKYIEYNSSISPINEEVLNSLRVYEYDKPKYGCTFEEFIENVLNKD